MHHSGFFSLSERVGANTTAVDDTSMIPLVMAIWLGYVAIDGRSILFSKFYPFLISYNVFHEC